MAAIATSVLSRGSSKKLRSVTCDVDLNLDGQEFAASRSEKRDSSRPATACTATRSGPQHDIQHGSAQRHLSPRRAASRT